jgi:HSP20 family protein
MAIIRYQPARSPFTAQREINRLFNTLFVSPTPVAGATSRRYVPALDVSETDGTYVLRADLPGVAESDVKVELKDDVLTISGERKSEREHKGEGFHRVERTSGSFSRSLTLPAGVDAQAITATFTNGVLEVTVTKPERQQPHQVQITVGAPAAVEAAESEAAPAAAPETDTSEAPAAA